MITLLSYLAPCSLSDFLKFTNSPSQKSVFPYQYFSSVTELRNATTFPKIEAFFSDLKQTLTCTEESYKEAKALFDSRIALSESDPKKWHSMVNFLEHYNNLGKRVKI